MNTIVYEIQQKVKVRKYKVDTDKLSDLLRSQKAKVGLSNSYIAKILNKPLTNVEHWFRKDKHFSIPDSDIWYKLKEILEIDTDIFDLSIMTFEEKENVYEKSNRLYDSLGIAPTITCLGTDLLILNKEINMEIERLGNIFGEDKGTGYDGNVWDKSKLCPTLQTMQGGYRQPMIIDEVRQLGNLTDNAKRDNPNRRRVYDSNALSPTLTSGMGMGGNLQPLVIEEVKETSFMDKETQLNTVDTERVLTENIIIGGEQKNQAIKKDGICTTLTSSMGMGGGYVPMVVTEQSIVRMVGRNPDNPNDRTVGIPTEQRLEPNNQGICNTITTVTKDNLVLEKNIKTVEIEENRELEKQYENQENTLNEPKECEVNSDEINDRCKNFCTEIVNSGVIDNPGIYTYDGYNNKVNHTDVIGTVVPHNSRWGLTCGHKVIDTTQEFRIRKLTPRECYRLMAVPEDDIDKMLGVNSNTQCYKQAGNSIVVNCLIALFSQMGIQGIPKWNEGLSDKYK